MSAPTERLIKAAKSPITGQRVTAVLSLPSRWVQLPDLQLLAKGCLAYVSIARRWVRHIVVPCAQQRSIGLGSDGLGPAQCIRCMSMKSPGAGHRQARWSGQLSQGREARVQHLCRGSRISTGQRCASPSEAGGSPVLREGRSGSGQPRDPETQRCRSSSSSSSNNGHTQLAPGNGLAERHRVCSSVAADKDMSARYVYRHASSRAPM